MMNKIKASGLMYAFLLTFLPEAHALQKKICRNSEIIIEKYQSEQHGNRLKDLLQQHMAIGSPKYIGRLAIMDVFNKPKEGLHVHVLRRKDEPTLLGCGWGSKSLNHIYAHVHSDYNYANIAYPLIAELAKCIHPEKAMSSEKKPPRQLHVATRRNPYGIFTPDVHNRLFALARTLSSLRGIYYTMAFFATLHMICPIPSHITPSLRHYSKALIFTTLCTGYIYTEQKLYRMSKTA